MKILVVDDNPLNRKYLRIILAQEGHAVVESEDGLAALERLKRDKIDAVISDLLMPRMDGYRLCGEIRKNPAWNSLPFIAYSATYTSPADEKVALDFGADRFLRKPAIPEVIVKALHEAMETTVDQRRPARAPDELLAMKEYSEVLVRKLEETNSELSEANEALNERVVLAEFNSRVSSALTHTGTLREILQLCAQAMVEHLDAAFARIWTSNSTENVLELQASAGMYTHIDGAHSKIPVGQFEIGLIAAERKPHCTNAAIGDPRVHAQEWAKREGMVAFAGYPLLVEDRLLGVMALFARKPLGQSILQAMQSVAQGIAAGIERKTRESELRRSEERFRELAENINEIFFVADPQGRQVYYVSPAHEQITGQECAAVYQDPKAWLDFIHPDDRGRVEEALRINLGRLDQEYRVMRPDGEVRWLRSRSFPVKDQRGEVTRVVGIATDITAQKQAEATVHEHLDRIRALHEIDLAISSTLDLNTVLLVLLEKIDLFIRYPSVTTLRLLNKETDKFELLACRNIDAEEWKREFVIGSRGRARRVLESKSPVIVRNLLADPSTHNPAFYQRHGLISYISLPLVVRNDAFGVFNLYTKEEHEFSAEEIDFLLTLAGQAAIAINNARLYEETERRRREAEELASIARSLTETLDMKVIGERVVSSVLKLFGVKGATLRLRESDGSLRSFAAAGEMFSETSEGAVVPAGMGLASRALAEHKPVWSADTLNDAGIRLSDRMRDYLTRTGDGSMIAVPLRARDNLIGVLTLGDRTGRRYFESEVELLQTFADQVALALQNAQLYEQSQSHLKRIEALREIDRAITSTLDLHFVLHLLLEKIDVFLPFPAATTIRLLNRATGKFDNAACRNIDEREWRARISQGTGNLSGQILSTKRPVVVPNIQEDAQRSASPFYRQYGFVSYLGVPLLAKDEVVGILGFYTKSPHDFTATETDALMTLAGQAAIAINNAQLYAEIDRSKKDLETTNRSLEISLKRLDSLYTALAPVAAGASTPEVMAGIIDRLVEATGADAALIRAWDPQSNAYKIVSHKGYSQEFLERLRVVPPGGSVDWVIHHGEPILAPDIAAEARFQGKTQLAFGFRSAAMLPLTAHDDVRGVLQISSRRLGEFDEAHKDHLVAIARQMGIALENRRLFEHLKSTRDHVERANSALTERNRMLSALHAVAAASSQSLNLDHVLNSAIQKITDLFHFDATQIHIYDKQLDELCLKASFENDPVRFSAARSFKMGQGIVGKVAQTGEKIIFADVQTDQRYKELSRTKTSGRHGYHFFAVFPMKGKTRNLGTIACVGAERRDLTASEIQLLEAIADQLAVAIENSELYEDLQFKVEELQRKTTELEQANKVKDDFLGVVSHELRTPINVIMGYTSLFKDGFFGEVKPEQEDALAKIARESKGLLAMINSVLHATTMDTEKLSLEIQEFSLESLLGELQANYAVTGPQQLSLHWHYPTGLPPLKTDRRMLKQILDNLIGNAVKFTEQGKVTIMARVGGGKERSCNGEEKVSESAPLRPQSTLLEFEVADTGVGIPSDRLELIFDKFYQVDSSETRRFGGIGIGL
ncbi:MAG TPA: GAF domain-containing protein, partial [Candidatus Binatia bacterium]